MVCIVEIVVTDEALPQRMNQMRVWLDHQRYAPSRFQVSDANEQSNGCRVYFQAQEEAVAFARQFGGIVLGALTTDAIL
jgi:hypothetical protein